MTAEQCHQYLLALPDATIDTPFGPQVLVFKVRGKMFATLGRHQGQMAMNLKADPYEAEALRDLYPGIIPGYHMNKRHWNTVFIDSSVPSAELQRMMLASYRLVVGGLNKAERELLLARLN